MQIYFINNEKILAYAVSNAVEDENYKGNALPSELAGPGFHSTIITANII